MRVRSAIIDFEAMTAYSTFPAGSGMLAKPAVRTELRLASPALFAAWSTVLILGYLVLDGDWGCRSPAH